MWIDLLTALALVVPPPTPWGLLRTAPLGLQTAPGALVFDAVKIVDVASNFTNCNATPGGDIDAVGAISSA